MGIRDRGRGGTPGQELKNFTDREDELAVFRRLLDHAGPGPLPAVMFYGLGGVGKSWLLRRCRAWLAEHSAVPSAYADFDRQSGGPAFVADPSALLAEVWRQWDVECPRFETAYAWMRFKQGAGDRPLVRHSGKASTGWDLVKESASAALSDVPGGNLLAWAGDKLRKAATDRIGKTAWGRYIEQQVGGEDFRRLSRQTAQEIQATLVERLGADLTEHLPTRVAGGTRAVLFLDTFEDLAGKESNDARRQLAEEPIRTLFAHLPGVLFVLFGRDRLAWDEVDPEWGDEANLEQHLLGGLSRHDATAFLGKCGIAPGPLLDAVLHVARDRSAPAVESYHPYALGLAADAIVAERGRGIEPTPASFGFARGDSAQLARRFLRSLHDEHPEQWITRLAQTPRFDEAAARAMDSATRDVRQDQAWASLRDYSFVQEDAAPGWFRLHAIMRDALGRPAGEASASLFSFHADWESYWATRSATETDDFAGLAWYHAYIRDPEAARSTWDELAERARKTGAMARHFKLLDWWLPTGIEDYSPTTNVEAGALNSLGVELSETSLGNRTVNLRKAIACYEAALRIYTEANYPADWAMVQNNLGNALRGLPTGDPADNLRKAIACYEAALRIHTKDGHPAEWAKVQNNLGLVSAGLPTGDRTANLRRAIHHYEAALRVYNEKDYPTDWARAQINLGDAYEVLPTGDRTANLHHAISFYEAALRVYTEDGHPAEWAWAQRCLGDVYSNLPTGNQTDNLQRAIACYEDSLRVYTEASYPADWAITQNNLGEAYSNLPTGNRDDNLRRAIDHYEAALRVQTEEDYPIYWAAARNNLGNAHGNIPTGDHDANLRRAIACYEDALRVYTEASFPFEWATIQNNLGTIYTELRTGDRDANLRRAIACYEDALRVYTETDYPNQWAATQSNLGVAFRYLPMGDRDANFRRAIACYEAALRVRTEHDYPSDWAATRHNLGLAYATLPTGDRSDNLRQAIACYEAALRVYTVEDYPMGWAMTRDLLQAAREKLEGLDP